MNINMNINNNYLTCPLCKNLFLKSLVRFHYENCKKKYQNVQQNNTQIKPNNNIQQVIHQTFQKNIVKTQHNVNQPSMVEITRKKEEELRRIQREKEIERIKEMEKQKQLEYQKYIEKQKEIERQKHLEQQRMEQKRLEYKRQLEKQREIYEQKRLEEEKHKKTVEINLTSDTQLERYIKPEIVSYNDTVLNHFFKQYEKLFSQFIDGKCIALVGPAESILNTGKGEIIDKFDLVVRLNKSIPLPTKIKEDIGTRTDIVYNSMNTSDFPGENNLSTRLYKKHNVKFMCSSYPFNHNIFHDDILNYVRKYKFDMPLKVMDDMKFKKFEKILGTRPYTGTCAIMDLLSYPIKYLYITGLDFYHSKYYGEYRHMSKEGQKYTKNSAIHKAKPQLEYLKNISLIDDRIILDEFLDKLIYHDYYKVMKHLKQFETNKIYQFGDEYLKQYFEMKTSYCTYTKTPSINNINELCDKNSLLTITDNKLYNKRNNEYCLFMTTDKGMINALNSNLESKKFIGNFFYTKNIHSQPSIYISDKFLLHIKNNVQRVGISNCNVNLAILISIMIYLPDKHIFSYNEIINGWKLSAEEKKFVLFIVKKKYLKVV